MAAALLALLRECQGLLIGAIGDADAFEADADPRLVHHREHAGHATIFLADKVTDRAALIAHRHGAGRRGVHAELVLDAGRKDIVARAQRAVFVDEEFRDQEQRDTAGAGGGIGQSRQHEMHDVVGHVVVAIGDVDLGAENAVAAIIGAFGATAQRTDVGAGLRFGQLHGTGPVAGHQLLEIDLFQCVAAMGVERLDGGERQQRAQAERHVRRAPDLGAGGVDRQRQALAAKRLRSGHRVPAGRGPALVGIRPTRRGGDLASGQRDAVLVADAVQRRQHLGGEATGLFQHGGGHVAVKLAIMAGLQRGPQPRAMVEGQQHVVDRGAVGHDRFSWAGVEPSFIVFTRNRAALNTPSG
jgi:hypothetical protein